MIKEFLRGKSPAHLLMLGALALLFFSQFFLYYDDEATGFLTHVMDDEYYTGYVQTGAQNIGTGWQLHPHAYVILVLLGFALLRDDIVTHPLFVRFGWWATLILVIAATGPGAYVRAFGASLGGIAVIMAFVAVLLRGLEKRRAAGTVPPPASPT